MAEKPTIPDFPTLPDFGQMITQACEVVASVRGIPYDFNGTLSLENKFVVLFKTVKEMFDAQDNLVKNYKALYNFVNNYFSNLDVQEEINNKIKNMANTGELTTLILPYIKESPVIVNSLDEMINHNYIYLLSTDGYLYSWNGTKFVKSGINYTYPTNAYVQKPYSLMTSNDLISSLNECGSYSVGVKDGDNCPADMPKGWTYGNYMVVVDGYPGGNKLSFIQHMYRKGEKRYNYRIINDNKASEWIPVDLETIYSHHSYRFMTSNDLISSLNECGSYSVGVKDGDNCPADMPKGWTYGNYMVVVDGYPGGNKLSFIQHMYRKGEKRYNYRIINDNKAGEWSTVDENTYNKVKVALCGDSFIASGGDGGLSMSEYLNYYPKYNATTLAKGGIKASEWLSTFSTKINATYDVFLISLGLNGESNDEIYKDSIKNIIRKINAVNPTARIILWCMDAWFPENYSSICEEISKNFGIEFYSMKAMSNIPIRIDGKYPDKFPALDSNFVTAKTNAYAISTTDHHPNINGRKLLAEFWSTII